MVSESAEFVIGSSVSCRDGPCGELTRVVVDPVARTVTHLVVEPPQRGGTSRLVPVRLAGAGTEAIQLRCTMAQFEGLQEAEETQIVPDALGDLGDGQDPSYLRPTTDAAAWDCIGEGTPGGKRRVAIPIGAVADFSDGVRLSLTKDEVRDLPLAGSAPGED